MAAIFFLTFVVVSFLSLVVLLFLIQGYRAWIYNTFNGLFSLSLLFICFLALKEVHQTDPYTIKITNYSKEKGDLYFFEGRECGADIRYGYSVNANEVSQIELGNNAEQLKTVVFLTEDDRLYQLPSPDYQQAKLEIWEKELELAEKCYWDQIKWFRRAQEFYSFAIGLLLFGILLLFFYKRKKSPTQTTGSDS